MSVWKDKNGRYHVAVQRGGTRVHRICPQQATWRDAKRKEAELEQRFQAVTTGKVLIADAIQHWLKTEVAHQKARRNTEGNALALAEWVIGKDLSQIVSVGEAYKRDNRGRLTNSTINRRLAVLRRVAALAFKRWGWLESHLAPAIELLPENPPRLEWFTRTKLAKTLRSIHNRERRRAVLVAAFTGIRRGLIAKYRPMQLQGDLIFLPTNKNGRPLMVPVVHHIRFALNRPINVHPDTLTHDIAKAAPGMRFHDLRRSAGSWLIQAGVDITVVSRILGHRDIRTTLRIYAHLLVDNLREGMAKLGKSAQRLHTTPNAGKEKAA